MELHRMLQRGLITGAGLLAIAGCSNGSDTTVTGYTVTSLVSDMPGTAANTDPNLVNPWGIVFAPGADVWIANNGTSVSTIYNGAGVLQSPTVAIPPGANGANPTGIVYNSTADFGAAPFIFDGEGGTLAAWTTGAVATTVYDDGAGGAIYKGLAIGSSSGANYLYATDFHNNKIDIFDGNFTKVAPAGSFQDPNAVAGYAPFGIQNINGQLYVTFAEQGPGAQDEIDGPGLGYVDVFATDGTFVGRLATGGALNAPWGIALAPSGFGSFGNNLLIGNFGDGAINAYNSVTSAYVGALAYTDGTPVLIPGLWGIAFGNGFDNQPADSLFFAAGINSEADGVYGRIDFITETTSNGGSGSGY